MIRQAQAESSSKLARGVTDDAGGGGDSGTVASTGRAPQVDGVGYGTGWCGGTVVLVSMFIS